MFNLMYFLILFTLAFADWSFIHMGDWGGTDAPTYTKSSQCQAADAMDVIAQKYNVDTVLAAGDNFYHYGVTQDDADGYFTYTFNNVYNGPTLQKAKFYAVAGNHDHRGDVGAQINYPNDRWVFPDYWYTFEKDIGNGMTAQFIMIDTVLLVGESYHDIERDIFVAATGPKNLQKAQSQWTFIENALAQSTADFLFVVGHYPVYAPCSHGSTQDLITYLKPLLEQYDVTAYIAGHDHCASHVDDGTGPVYPMNGMGDTCCYKAKKLRDLRSRVGDDAIKFYVDSKTAKNYGGVTAAFNSYTLSPSGLMNIRYHDQDGKIMFETVTTSRRVQYNLSSSSITSLPAQDILKLFLISIVACVLGFSGTILFYRSRKPATIDDVNLDEDLMATATA